MSRPGSMALALLALLASLAAACGGGAEPTPVETATAAPVPGLVRVIGGARETKIAGIAVRAEGGMAYVASTVRGGWEGTAPADPGWDALLFAVEQDGTLAWRHRLTGEGRGHTHESLGGVAVAPDGTIHFVGTTNSPAVRGQSSAGGSDVLVGRVAPDGGSFEVRLFGAGGEEGGHAIAVLPDGSLVIAGWTRSESLHGAVTAGGYDAFIARLDRAAQPIWVRVLGGRFDDSAWAVAVGADASIYVAGALRRPREGVEGIIPPSDAFVARYDLEGNELWRTAINKAGGAAATGIDVDENGVYVSGSMDPSEEDRTGQQNAAFVAALDHQGAVFWRWVADPGLGPTDAPSVVATGDAVIATFVAGGSAHIVRLSNDGTAADPQRFGSAAGGVCVGRAAMEIWLGWTTREGVDSQPVPGISAIALARLAP